MTATLHDLLKSYREGGVFPSYDQLAAIAGQDQSGAAVRGEAVAESEPTGLPPISMSTYGTKTACELERLRRTQRVGPDNLPRWIDNMKGSDPTIDSLIEYIVSTRAADAPSEPSVRLDRDCELLTMAQVNAIRDTIKPGDGWDSDDWDFALANAVAANVKSRAADALDSQPTEPFADVQARVRDAVAENLRGLYYCGRVWSAWSVGTMGEDDFSPAEEDDDIIANITDAVMATLAPASSQPTVSAVFAELRADLRELANNTDTFGEHSQEAARVAFDSATDALDEVAAKYASSQPTELEGCEVCLHTYCMTNEKCSHCGHVAESQGWKGGRQPTDGGVRNDD